MKDKILVCDYCKKEYLVLTNVYNNVMNGKQKNHCCSKKCADQMTSIRAQKKREEWPIFICDWCNKEFKISPFYYKEKTKNKFYSSCSRECAQKLLGEKSKKDAEKRHNENWERFNCGYCGKEFIADEWKAKTARFCSKECMSKFKTQSATIILICQFCGKDFQVLQGQLNFWGELKYCSKECRGKASRKRVNFVCTICGKEYWQHLAYSKTSVCCSKECHKEWLKIYSNMPEVKERLRRQGINSQINQKKSYTLPERIVLKYLSENNIKFIPQHVIGDILTTDFFLPDYNCCLEVYGDYWHSNPLKYGDDKKPLNEMQIKNKQKDIRRYKVITQKYGFYFYSLWEYDIKNNLENKMNKFFEYIDSKIRNEYVVL